ncbi:hypothetical protein [Novosphingobium sp. BL-52-GroH]|uniref:hypothetical protein n=1 Tax=Novosphingobium sp. BL-52-GroH TaxID=3349877 RepID=UPI00384E7BE0
MASEVVSRRPVWLWGAAFFVGMFGTGLGARFLDLPSIPSMLVMIPPMLLLIPFVRASERAQAECGAFSPATRRYNRRGLIWSFAYVLLLSVAVVGSRTLHAQGPLLWVLAILPALPILYLLWAMRRYLVEEQDEYLRKCVVNAALSATGLLLGVATVWGFLETFGLVPHVPGWAAVPVWAIGLGLGTFVNRWRGA